MIGFFREKKDKAVWAAMVFSQPARHPEKIPEEQLIAATGMMIAQHKRIILESAEIVRTTRNQSTRTERLELCKAHYRELLKLERFADREQKHMIADCKAAVKDLILISDRVGIIQGLWYNTLG